MIKDRDILKSMMQCFELCKLHMHKLLSSNWFICKATTTMSYSVVFNYSSRKGLVISSVFQLLLIFM